MEHISGDLVILLAMSLVTGIVALVALFVRAVLAGRMASEDSSWRRWGDRAFRLELLLDVAAVAVLTLTIAGLAGG